MTVFAGMIMSKFRLLVFLVLLTTKSGPKYGPKIGSQIWAPLVWEAENWVPKSGPRGDLGTKNSGIDAESARESENTNRNPNKHHKHQHLG